MIRLFIDVGNTALKWRLRNGDSVVQGGGVHGRDWARLARVIQESVTGELEGVWVASVAGKEADALIAAELSAAFGLTPEFYYSVAHDFEVSNRYAESQRLGVDRWLAVIEAWHQSGPSIVVDCGSALTLDAVDVAGKHLGGYIVPGLKMLEDILLQGTGSVRFAPARGAESLGPGASTGECVQNGVMRMTVAFITDAVVALQQAVQDTCSIFLTGGDAELVARWLDMPVSIAPDMVLDGLERVAGPPGRGE